MSSSERQYHHQDPPQDHTEPRREKLRQGIQDLLSGKTGCVYPSEGSPGDNFPSLPLTTPFASDEPAFVNLGNSGLFEAGVTRASRKQAASDQGRAQAGSQQAGRKEFTVAVNNLGSCYVVNSTKAKQKIENLLSSTAMIQGLLEVHPSDHYNFSSTKCDNGQPLWLVTPVFEDLAVAGCFPFVRELIVKARGMVQKSTGKSRWMVVECVFGLPVCEMSSLVATRQQRRFPCL